MNTMKMIQFNPDFPLKVVRIDHHWTTQRHVHDFHELVLITSGRSTHVTATECYTVSAGDIFVVKPGEPHAYESNGEFALVNLLFRPELFRIPSFDLTSSPGYLALFELEPELREARGLRRHLRLEPAALDRVAAECEKLRTLLVGDEPGYQFAAAAIFSGIVAFLSQYFSKVASCEDEYGGIFELSRILSHLERNYPEPVDLTELARKSAVSRSTLYRLFVRATGVSPHRYLERLRLSRAKALLLNTDLDIVEIARRSGFPDSNYFSRSFRRATGLTPSAFRWSK